MTVKATTLEYRLTNGEFDVSLRQGENFIGRATGAVVCINSPKVSRRHACITVTGDTALIEDLGSKNGTYVGNTRIDKPIPLSHGDQLRFGQITAPLRVMIADRRSTVTDL